MTFLNSIISDLREKRLWPVAVALLAGLVAVPIVLLKSAAKVPVTAVAQGAANASGPSPSTALPVVTVTNTPSHSRLKGHGRDPFTQQKLRGASLSATTGVSTTTNGGTGGNGGAWTAGSTTTGGTGGTGTTTTPTTPTTPTTTTTPTTPTTPIVPSNPSKPAPTALTADESYAVTISITNSHGGVDKINPLERLGLLPSNRAPMLINLGVLKGGNRALFDVQPGTYLQGPGTCTPGPIDCEIISLRQGQVETILRRSPSGLVTVAQFAVTAIKADRHPSSSAADKARNQVSALGRRLLNKSGSPALSLFPFKPSLGALVDLRDLKVGGR